ncbi:hypothetical protein [Tahibacter amnicola]|uniref:Uncharacterized protein n=1 Tax=Tahibacter amnicola TaxID=2976241 RepID=A0ABY6BB03_9GAMM|nr:hypothetical protein [Tahibacter amnicola]UXI66328.1 hypothetical protein N4264_16405 [Tahibacter amnicola]
MRLRTIVPGSALLLASALAAAHGIDAKPTPATNPDFDIVSTRVSAADRYLQFEMTVSGKAGNSRPSRSGKMAGSDVFSYVWPTKLDSAVVGFDKEQGILALAATAHPDFDDTPWFDENGNANSDDDGDVWHSHWVVLVNDDQCGKGMLKVKDIPPGATPRVPATWPGVPLLLDSPGYTPVFAGNRITVRVPFANARTLHDTAFDGVTAGLRINASMHAPLLCVVAVNDVASGDLSLPGRVE